MYISFVIGTLPKVDNLLDIDLQTPMRVYSQDGKLMAEIGKKHRIPVKYEQLPDTLVHAFTAAEDQRFFDHSGVDYRSLVRAALKLITTGKKSEGGSTITMQVARNYLLSREKTFLGN